MSEVVIIGGGIVGLSAAWSLGRRGIGGVAVLEAGLCGQGSTGKATGGVRCQFGTEINVRLSVASLPYFQRWQDVHGGEVGYRPVGYIFLASSEQQVAAQAQGLAVQRACGARAEFLTAAQTREFLQGVDLSGIRGSTFGPDDGLADPGLAVTSLVVSCKRTGVVIDEGVHVEGLVVEDGRVRGVVTKNGQRSADVVIVAAGPWSPQVLSGTGYNLPVTPRHRQVYRAIGIAGLSEPFPFVVDLETGVYFHTDSNGVIFGGGDREGSLGYDDSYRSEEAPRIINLLSRRLPQALDAQLAGGWAGIRDMTPDDVGVVGWVPGTEGLLVAAGFSGHGFMHAPAVGEVVAGLVANEEPTFDLSALAPTRFESGLRRESYVF